MSGFRSAIPDFQLANPLYTGARVSFFTVDINGASTGVLATLYAAATGSVTALNPQTLDADGKFTAAVYIDQPVIAQAVGANIGSHTTGVIGIAPRNRQDYLTGTVYYSGDFIRDPVTGDWYMAADNFTASTLAADVAASKMQAFFIQAALLTGIFTDNHFSLLGHLDQTKVAVFNVSAISPATTRTLSLQDANGTVALNVNNLSFFASTTSAQLAGVISDETGTGALVFATSPTLVTPVLGVATATSINKVAITAPATGSTLTIADGKTLTASNTLTFTGTDSSSIAFGGGGTVAYVANNLSVFAATTSAQLAGVISDETGSGALVFGTAPTITGGTHTAITGLGIRSTGAAFDLTLASSEVLTAGRTLSLILGDAARSLTIGASASVSGSNTGDQTITLTGDVTGSGTGSFATAIGSTKIMHGMLNVDVVTGMPLRNTIDTTNDFLFYYSAATGLLEKATLGAVSSAATAGVSSFNGRVGAVSPTSGDYSVGQVTGAAASGANTDITSVLLSQTGLVVKGASANALTIKPNETLSAGRTLNLIVNDASRTINLGGDVTTAAAFVTSGAFSLTLTATGATNVTLPTSGTLATTDASSLTSGTLPSGRISFATASDLWTGTDTTKPGNAKAHADADAWLTLTDGATISWDMSQGYNAKVTLGGNRTLNTPTNSIAGRTYALQVIQDGTGSRGLTLPSSSIFDFGGVGSPTFSTGIGKIDMLYLICLNTGTPLFKASFSRGS